MKFCRLLPAVASALTFVACETPETPVAPAAPAAPMVSAVATPAPVATPTKAVVKKAAAKAPVKKAAAPKAVKKEAVPQTETIKKIQRVISTETIVS